MGRSRWSGVLGLALATSAMAGGHGGPTGFLGDTPLLVGGAFLHAESDVGSRELFLSYPSSSFDFPEMLYGVYVDLEAPITAEQVRQLRDFVKGHPERRGVQLFVEVRDPSPPEPDFRVRGRLVGYGFHPGERFARFSNGDLGPEHFFPFREPRGKAREGSWLGDP